MKIDCRSNSSKGVTQDTTLQNINKGTLKNLWKLWTIEEQLETNHYSRFINSSTKCCFMARYNTKYIERQWYSYNRSGPQRWDSWVWLTSAILTTSQPTGCSVSPSPLVFLLLFSCHEFISFFSDVIAKCENLFPELA